MTCLGHTAHRRKWSKTDCTPKAQTLLIHFPGETTSADSANLPRYLRPAGRIHPSSLETTASTRPQFSHTAWLLPQPEHGRPQYPLTAVTRRLLQGRVGGWTARGPGWPKDTAGHRSGAQHQLTLPSSRHTLQRVAAQELLYPTPGDVSSSKLGCLEVMENSGHLEYSSVGAACASGHHPQAMPGRRLAPSMISVPYHTTARREVSKWTRVFTGCHWVDTAVCQD